MLKLLSTLFCVVAVFLTLPALATVKGSVAPCSTDKLTSERIAEVSADTRIDVLNAKAEVVGALVLTGKTGVEMSSLYLCGDNTNYFYAEGDLMEIGSKPSPQKFSNAFYNDEYDSETIFESGAIDSNTMALKITISVKFSGEEEWADYGPFTEELFLTVPMTR